MPGQDVRGQIPSIRFRAIVALLFATLAASIVVAGALADDSRTVTFQGGRVFIDGKPTLLSPDKVARVMGTKVPPPPTALVRPEPARATKSAVRPAVASLAVGANINASRLSGPQSEVVAAINPKNPLNVVLGSNDLADNPVRAYVSFDGGLNWTSRQLPLPPGYSFASDPVAVADLDGNWYFNYIVVSPGFVHLDVLVSKSTDGGLTWATPAFLTNVGLNDKPWMAVDATPTSPREGSVYVAWDRPFIGVYFSRSTDGGATFSSPIRVDVLDPPNDARGTSIYAMPAVAPNGDVYVVWEDYNGLSNVPSGIFLRRSTDGGSTWGPQVKITTTNIKTFNPFTCIPAQNVRCIAPVPVIAVDSKNDVHLVYGDRALLSFLDADTDIFYRRSTDFGATWSGRVKLNDDATTTSQFFPWLAIDPLNNLLLALWYDARDDVPNNTKTNVYVTSSDDRGATWSANLKVTTEQSDETIPGANLNNQYGDYLGIAAYGGTAHAGWADGRLIPTRGEEVFTAKITYTLPRVNVGDASILEGDDGTRELVVPVTLNTASTGDVSVMFATAPGGATSGGACGGDVDFVSKSGSVTFAVGESAKSIRVTICGDTRVEPNETLTVSLSHPTGIAIERGQATGTIINDDKAASDPAPEPDPSQRGNNEREKERPLTATERQQGERTNRLGLDDYRTEGNVVTVDPASGTPTIATRDGLQIVELRCQDGCGEPRVGDYLEADGVKEHEGLFFAENVTLRRAKR
jgi:hypothetical protein